eukprot:4687666-Pleurochrysis_carterae.AAC.1
MRDVRDSAWARRGARCDLRLAQQLVCSCELVAQLLFSLSSEGVATTPLRQADRPLLAAVLWGAAHTGYWRKSNPKRQK